MLPSTPVRPPPSSAPSSRKQQRSILSYFGRPPSGALTESTRANCPVTPLASSDPAGPDECQARKAKRLDMIAAVPDPSLSPVTPTELPLAASSDWPTARQVKKPVSYAESSAEDEDSLPSSQRVTARRRNRPRARILQDDDDENGNGSEDGDYVQKAGSHEPEAADDDEMMADLIESDSFEEKEALKHKKRKRQATGPPAPRKRATSHSPSASVKQSNQGVTSDTSTVVDEPQTSTAQQWVYDPAIVAPTRTPPPVLAPAISTGGSKSKEKACHREPEERYPWLADLSDINRNPRGHVDHDGSTVYIPPHAWNKFTPFEKQYWEIKQKLYDTVVFFKKGKFYELYENDATIGHQLFDLKLTDRVNMRMVGVPESSLDIWVNQFVAKGYKVARVDQMESALGKEMRERTSTSKASEKVIRRELACILTAGTLVDGSMLPDDHATYCVAVKEEDCSGGPDRARSFGIAFVDTATGRFFLSEFVDDADMTRFETLIAQINPRELLLEKSRLSAQARRILKNNCGATTIWNQLQSGSEFWDADTTRRELDAGRYFALPSDDSDPETSSGGVVWPPALESARNDEAVMSALGALVYYLRVLKLDHALLSHRRFERYNPLERSGTLVLDGQTLINLEVFANSIDGGSCGTLFALLNRCVTPAGKRLLKRWVSHPLCHTGQINERLDAVELLNADVSAREQFASQLARMPDLERLLSRIHAGACRADDFVRVLDAFEQIGYAVGLVQSMLGRAAADGHGTASSAASTALLARLVSAMPDLGPMLEYWKTAFDRKRAREERALVPEPGIAPDYDSSRAQVAEVEAQLRALLEEQKAKLECRTLRFTDIGKEIYQIEAPKAFKVPASWRQMSATATVRRYYFGRLTDLVRTLQEALELRAQVGRDVAARLLAQFDVDRDTWLLAVEVTAQLDCLVSLARISTSVGEPSCRPQFVDADRSEVAFEELRHPCLVGTVADFIPNDIRLGGDLEKMSLLTGANAAGKSTVLRMTCIAVLMAQIGCRVPARSARLTPVDRIMSRLGARDNIFAGQSTFLVELRETNKILAEATDRSLVILDELGRGTSSFDGMAIAQAVLHHLATHVGCLGFFATHYHALAAEFATHPEVRPRRMQIRLDPARARSVVFLYRLEDGVADRSFGIHCAAMCGVPASVVDRAELAAERDKLTSRQAHVRRPVQGDGSVYIPLGFLSDVAHAIKGEVTERGLEVLFRAIERL